MVSEEDRAKGERIVAAAIREGACVFTGPHHATIIHYIVECAGIKPVKGEQGFMTSAGRFVNRYQARRIALRAGQVDTIADSLLSEELWIVPEWAAEQEATSAPPRTQETESEKA